jgi:hypothetical protein
MVAPRWERPGLGPGEISWHADPDNQERIMPVADNAKLAFKVVLLDDVFTAAGLAASQFVKGPEDNPKLPDAKTASKVIDVYHQQGWFHEARRKEAFSSVRGGNNVASGSLSEFENKARDLATKSRAMTPEVAKDYLYSQAGKLRASLESSFSEDSNVTLLLRHLSSSFDTATEVLVHFGKGRPFKDPPGDWATSDAYDAKPLLQLAFGERSGGQDFEARKRRLAYLKLLIDAIFIDDDPRQPDPKKEKKDKLYEAVLSVA